MIIFDGYQAAAERETQLKPRVAAVQVQGFQPHIAAILFTEDAGSQLYTRLKREAAERVGIVYQVFEFSLHDELQTILAQLHTLNSDTAVTGIIIQKPGKQTWLNSQGTFTSAEEGTRAFQNWWQQLVSEIVISKDVDGLHPQTLQAIKEGTWQSQKYVMPATAKAVLEILKTAVGSGLTTKKVVVLGKSDIVGKPLFYALQSQNTDVQMIGSKELNEFIEQKKYLFDYDIVISSTGRPGLITADLLKEGSVVIDVGEPKADVDRTDLETKAAFLTPVPGGVGPMTVVCLLENALRLIEYSI